MTASRSCSHIQEANVCSYFKSSLPCVDSDIYCFVQRCQPVSAPTVTHCNPLHISTPSLANLQETLKYCSFFFKYISQSVYSIQISGLKFTFTHSTYPAHLTLIDLVLIQRNIFKAGQNTVERSPAPVDTQESRCQLDTDGRRRSCGRF